MADTTHSTTEVDIATLDGQIEDFGLVDYEPPVADTQSVEASDSKPSDEVENVADGLIDYKESDYESDNGAEYVDTEQNHESKGDDNNAIFPESVTTNVTVEQPSILAGQKEEYFDADDIMVISDEDNVETSDQFSDAEDYDKCSEDIQQWNETDIENGFVPETWVYSEGEWVLYLGPDQRSYTKEFQSGLFALHLDQLMNVLHGDFLLGDDMELALEFPSLDLIIDQRDTESRQVDLKQLYNCHIAAVEMGKLPLDYANSPFYSSSQGTFCPLPESFSFVIRTRHKPSLILLSIMQTANDHAKHQTKDLSQDSDLPQTTVTNGDKQNDEHPVVVEIEEEEVVVENGANPDEQHAAEDVEDAETPEEADTAELIAEVEDEDEDEDDDFVPGDEEKEDHVLDPDVVDEEDEEENDDLEEGTSASHVEEETEEVEEETEEVEEEGAKTRVDSQCASPSNKRTKEQLDTKTAEEPVSKKAKSDEQQSAT